MSDFFFGLPPIEALACGCVVFSSLNHALADLLDPGVKLGHQIGCASLAHDLARIEAVAPRGFARGTRYPEEAMSLLDG